MASNAETCSTKTRSRRRWKSPHRLYKPGPPLGRCISSQQGEGNCHNMTSMLKVLLIGAVCLFQATQGYYPAARAPKAKPGCRATSQYGEQKTSYEVLKRQAPKFPEQIKVGKSMVFVLWNQKGILGIDFFPQGDTFDAIRYYEILKKLRRDRKIWSRQELRAWNDFRVKYSKTGNDGYFAMPRSLSDPLMKNYVQVPFNNKYNVKLYCYPNDPRVCLMFDKAGNVAGIQISFLKSELVHGAKTLPYDFARQGIFEATNFFNKPAWSFRAFFTNPDHLASGGTRTKTSETADSIFVKLDNKWFEVDRKEPAQGGAGHMKDFVQQSCIPGMGFACPDTDRNRKWVRARVRQEVLLGAKEEAIIARIIRRLLSTGTTLRPSGRAGVKRTDCNHYFYKFNEQMKCEDMKAFFPMYEDGSLVSFGIMSFGEHHHLTRPWLETPSADRGARGDGVRGPGLRSWALPVEQRAVEGRFVVPSGGDGDSDAGNPRLVPCLQHLQKSTSPSPSTAPQKCMFLTVQA
ncbi:hypothetical protein AAG570_001029 [Ranatra chinensis]|uniref:Uncharacterized protein n=1 Tax=Ranatra chinensis TaxID=642074 RepID=A0ABD0YAN3_9HEMI